jgi:hypothetical protein
VPVVVDGGVAEGHGDAKGAVDGAVRPAVGVAVGSAVAAPAPARLGDISENATTTKAASIALLLAQSARQHDKDTSLNAGPVVR